MKAAKTIKRTAKMPVWAKWRCLSSRNQCYLYTYHKPKLQDGGPTLGDRDRISIYATKPVGMYIDRAHITGKPRGTITARRVVTSVRRIVD